MKMNKKYLMFGLMALFAIGIVTAAIGYYAMFSTTLTVVSAITVSDCSETIKGTYYGGDVIIGKVCDITNNADTERIINLTNDADENVDVSYWQGLELTKKIISFESDNWNVTKEKSYVNFVTVGDEFNAIVPEGYEKDGYVLIYYKDDSDRFNSPAKAILIENIEGNLPYEDDKNAYEYEYCIDEENYLSCHGAKIWYVPLTAINEDDTLDWNRASEFYFETDLIEYNSEGIITIYPKVISPLTPYYTTSNYLNDTVTITTTIA